MLSWWAGRAPDEAERAARGQQASNYYGVAVKLSPYNPTLWGEWAILLLDVLRQPELALEKLNHAVELDDQYSFTQGLMGDYYRSLARAQADKEAKRAALETAATYYQRAYDVTTFREVASRSSYLVSLGNIYIELANLDPQNIDNALVQQAIDSYLQALEAGPKAADVWKIEETVAKLYVQLGDKVSALTHANAALAAAPEAQQARVQQLIDQINALP